MKQNHRCLIQCTMIVSIMILSLPSINYTQERDQQGIRSIVLQITTPKGHWAKASVVEGEMITIVDENTGVGYGFMPVIRSVESRRVEVKTLQVTGKALDVKALKEVESSEIKVGAQQQLSISFEIKVLAITQDFKDQDVSGESAIKPPDARTRCCITCFGQTICAGCWVITDCGCCCGGGYCCGACKQPN